jgi:hypothetical protein
MGFRSDILRMRDKQAALAHVERVGKGVRVLIDTADPSRVERAEGITDRVNPIRDSLSEVAATVAGTLPVARASAPTSGARGRASTSSRSRSRGLSRSPARRGGN